MPVMHNLALDCKGTKNGPFSGFLVIEAPGQGKRAEPKRASPRESPKLDCDEVSSRLPKTYQNTPLATVVLLAPT